MEVCPKCRSLEIDTGSLSGGKMLSYASQKVRVQAHKNNVRARVCMSCGYAEMYVDTDYMQKIRTR